MAISECGAGMLDETAREKKAHGDYGFPVAIYHDILEEEEVAWHWHMELELNLVVSGEGYFACNGQDMLLRAGQAMFINSGNLHSCRVSPAGHCEIHSVVFHPRFVAGGTDTVLWSRYVAPLTDNKSLSYRCFDEKNQADRELLTRLEEAWQKMREEAEGYEFLMREALSRLVYQLYLGGSGAGNADSDVRKINRVKAMMEFIQKNYMEDLRLSEISDAALVSESECQRCFKSVLHTTPVKYLMNTRLQKAGEYLAHTDLPAAKIAELCGFPDNSYFGKLFKREMNMTPGEYRTAHRNPANNVVDWVM